jgi:hypothetical protein
VTVAVTPAVALTVDNCSYQWHADGVTLDDTSRPSSPFGSMHTDINTAYRAMLSAMGERACLDEARKKPPERHDDKTPGCDLPYTIDGQGRKIWKRECL